MSFPAKLQEQLDLLGMFPDRSERIDALIGIAEQYSQERASSVPRTEDRRVPGCESEVFLDVVHEGNGLGVHFAVDNPQGISAMALAVILESGVEGASAFEIAQIDENIVFEVFGRELSMGKSLGRTGMVRMLRDAARKCAG